MCLIWNLLAKWICFSSLERGSLKSPGQIVPSFCLRSARIPSWQSMVLSVIIMPKFYCTWLSATMLIAKKMKPETATSNLMFLWWFGKQKAKTRKSAKKFWKKPLVGLSSNWLINVERSLNSTKRSEKKKREERSLAKGK